MSMISPESQSHDVTQYQLSFLYYSPGAIRLATGHTVGIFYLARYVDCLVKLPAIVS